MISLSFSVNFMTHSGAVWLCSYNNYKARDLCVSVCPLHILRTVKLIYFILGECVAEGLKECVW